VGWTTADMACSLVMKDERRSERIVVAGPNSSSTLQMPSCVPLFGRATQFARSHVFEPGHMPPSQVTCSS